MEKKRDSLLKRRLKWKFFWGVMSILIFISPFLMILLLFAGIAPAAEESVVADYKTAAEEVGCSWQELLAFDTVRYENDFDEADPFQSALEFMSIYYEKYEKEVDDGVVHWVLVDRGWLDSPAEIRKYFHLSDTADVNAVTEAMQDYDRPKYVIVANSKDIEDVIAEHEFDQDQIKWIGSLITEGILNEMFGEEYDLPEFITAGNGYFGWPAPGNTRVTCDYGSRIMDGQQEFHYGVDIGAAIGSPVVAIEDGVVISAGTNGGTAGTVVNIRHEKDGYVWGSKYFHLSEIKVSVGDTVKRGTVIAASGNTGRSTGPHLHIGITMNGSYVDPLPLITE
jgi:murein DD-endopeptidase MepM/ murein hydrolase activator NlpD